MKGKRVLVTGATDGIGRETAKALVQLGAEVILHGRNAARLREARHELELLGGLELPEPWRADLAVLDEVRRGAEKLGGAALDVLINNAGVFMNERRLTVDGFEVTLQVNHLAPFLLTHLLLPALEASGAGRVVNVSSVAHTRGKIDPDDFTLARGFSGYGAYAASKLCNVLFTTELARRLGARPVTVNALHPGVVSTKLLQQGFGMGGPDSLAEGAATSVYLATSDEVASITGKYFVRSREATPARTAQDPALAQRLYDRTATAVGIENLGTHT